jgi:hypothetical protein
MNRQFFSLGFMILLFLNAAATDPMTYRQKISFDKELILDAMYKAKTWQEAQHEG